MELSKLINCVKGYDILILYALEHRREDVVVEKFYLKKEEFISFADNFDKQENGNSRPLSYKYFTQLVNLSEFSELFDLNVDPSSEYNLIYGLNKQLAKMVIHFSFSGKEKQIKVEKSDPTREKLKAIIDKYNFDRTEQLTNLPTLPRAKTAKDSSDDEWIFRMFNVGQACMSALLSSEEKQTLAVFDLGERRKCASARFLLTNQLSTDPDTPTTVVISHYDDDHICSAKHIPSGGFYLRFFIPEFLFPTDKYRPNVLILLNKIISNGKNYTVIGNDSLTAPLVLDYLTFLQGSSTRKDANQRSDENSHGLFVLLGHKENTVAIPGDMLYEDIITTSSLPINAKYVILPHHSCNYHGAINPAIINLKAISEAFAFCGPHRGHHHPNKTHFGQYMKNGTKLFRLKGKHDRNKVFKGKKAIADNCFSSSYHDYYDWKI